MQHAHVLLQGHAVDGQAPANGLIYGKYMQIPHDSLCFNVFPPSTVYLNCGNQSYCLEIFDLTTLIPKKQLRLCGSWKPSTTWAKKIWKSRVSHGLSIEHGEAIKHRVAT